MADPQAALAAQVSAALIAELGPEYAGTDPVIRPSAFADFQSNVALALGRRVGQPSRELASRIAGRLTGSPEVESAEVSGPGFINITLSDTWIAQMANDQLADPRLGVPLAEPKHRVVVDYSAPNVAKEMHVGRSEEHTSELQSHLNLVCRLLLEKKNKRHRPYHRNSGYSSISEPQDDVSLCVLCK